MRTIIILTTVLLSVFSVQAQEKSKNKKVGIEVSGICEMCKDRIEKAAFATKGVKSAEWHADDQILHLVINEHKTDVSIIQSNMAAIGHDTKDVAATDEAYNGLHGCCKYERKLLPNTCGATCEKSCCKDKEQAKKSCCASTGAKSKASCSAAKK